MLLSLQRPQTRIWNRCCVLILTSFTKPVYCACRCTRYFDDTFGVCSVVFGTIRNRKIMALNIYLVIYAVIPAHECIRLLYCHTRASACGTVLLVHPSVVPPYQCINLFTVLLVHLSVVPPYQCISVFTVLRMHLSVVPPY